MLPFDKDIDLALPFQEMGRAHSCLLKAGWRFSPVMMKLDNPLAYVHAGLGVTLDLCGIEFEAATGRHVGGFWRKDLPREWWRVIEYPVQMSISLANGPAGRYWRLVAAQDWLAALYGPTWRTPDPDFDTVVAAYNLRGFAPLTEYYALSRIYNHWHGGWLTKALATVRHSQRHLPSDALLARVAAHLSEALAQLPPAAN